MNPGNVAGPLFVVLAVLILRQRPRHAMGRLYLLVGLVLITFAVTNSWLVSGLPDGFRLLFGWYASWAWAVPVILVGTFGLLLLPDGHLPSPRWRWLARASALGIICFVLGMPYDDSVDAELRAAMPPWGAPVGEVAILVGFVIVLLTVLASLAAPLVRMVRGGPRTRQQLAPVAVAAVTAVVIYGASDAITAWLPVDHDVVLAVVVGLLPVGVTVAVLRRGLFDIHRLVSRVVSHTVVVGVLAAAYLALVLALGTLARALTGESGDLVVAVSTLAVAALFQPLRGRVRSMVDRRFDRSSYDAARTVEDFGRGLRDEVRADAVIARLRGTVAASVDPALVGIVVLRPVEEITR